MPTFNLRLSLQYLNSAGTPDFEGDGEPLLEPVAGDYSADLPTGYPSSCPLVCRLGTVTGLRLNFNPSPFTLIREIDPNQFPSTSSDFDQGFN